MFQPDTAKTKLTKQTMPEESTVYANKNTNKLFSFTGN